MENSEIQQLTSFNNLRPSFNINVPVYKNLSLLHQQKSKALKTCVDITRQRYN